MGFGELPAACEVCGKPFGEHFFDGKTPNGQWALICHKCHGAFGYGLGIDKAQKYDTKTKRGVDGFQVTP